MMIDTCRGAWVRVIVCCAASHPGVTATVTMGHLILGTNWTGQRNSINSSFDMEAHHPDRGRKFENCGVEISVWSGRQLMSLLKIR